MNKTNQHPLTNEKCEALFTLRLNDAFKPVRVGDAMRGAADWQLERVMNWLKSELGRGCYLEPLGYDGHEIDVNYVLEDLKEAMRPQQQDS